ncbi:hypothetical protein [Bailinhaonella thermotolerans]|uniref:Phenylacetate-CoA ligase n=1 Tax=Bailinhaonella thermotolerans TaxID=1070861 RepID=A0A3A4B4W0_9ACTN|nr:hypothetical protein [Bailinhaonella thermotolerans]RJL26582.1 hypothetical protein D5H75_26765 [Bailinhaonella thermotolerans]
MSAPARWLTREDLSGKAASGLLLASPDADTVYPMTSRERTAATVGTGAALTEMGVRSGDRVVVALAGDGDLAGPLWAGAAAEVAAAGASVGPRGRLRLHHALEAMRANTLVITPTGAMDFLARLHLEFLLDPLDLGLRTIIVTGEIASRRTLAHLASEFEARVVEAYSCPFTGVPLAWRDAEDAPLTPFAADRLGLAALGKDSAQAPPYPAGLAELVLTPGHEGLGDAVVRTGQVVRLDAGADAIPAPAHTVGGHVLIRGRWLPLARVERAMARIDGVSTWDLSISREGTLDAATLRVSFNRASLTGNPMWRSRIQQSIAGITPISIAVDVAEEVVEQSGPGTVTDLRGHHLGTDRSAL